VGKLIVWNIISLDGYFEGDEAWDLELHEHIWGSELRELSLSFGDELGLLVFGRATYEGMAAYWQNDPDEAEIAVYMNAAPKLVASRTITEATWQNTEVTSDIVGELTRRKQLDDRPTPREPDRERGRPPGASREHYGGWTTRRSRTASTPSPRCWS
jgi:dihydrofolate reductase